MRRTKGFIAIIGATVVATMAVGMPGASAIDSKCLYPPSKAALSVGLSTTVPTAGQPVYVRGRMAYNGCGANGGAITVRAGGKTIGSRITDKAGGYAVRFTPQTRTSVYAAGSFGGKPVKSRTIGVLVRTNLRATKAVAGKRCTVAVKGTILPERKGLSISVQRRVTKGTKFVGWETIATARTSAKGAYATTVTLPCNRKTGVSTYIAPTKTNAANRSTTITVTPKK